MTTRAVQHQNRLVIVVIGDNHHPQWNGVWSACDPSDCLFSGPTFKTAKDLVTSGLYPDLLLLFEDHVHQFAEEDWLSFHRSSPLTRTVIVFTDWCESEPRTGFPLPGVTRIHWLRWTNWGREFIDSLRQPSASQWHLPLTASQEERLLADLHGESSIRAHTRFKHIGVVTPSRESFAWIEGAVSAFGDCVFWIRESSGLIPLESSPDLLIVDLWDEPITGERMIEALRRGAWPGVAPKTLCIVLANFPHWEVIRKLRCLGQVRVLPKPVLLADLERAITDLGKPL